MPGPANKLVLVGLALLALMPRPSSGQQLEPRNYSNLPLGMSFAIAAYTFSEGDVLPDPSVPAKDANARIHAMLGGYARSFGLWGQSGLVSVAVPYASATVAGLLEAVPTSVERSGFGDPMFRVSYNFVGAPALSLKEFASYRQDTIIGASLAVTAPWGRYDPTKLINIGTNRWMVKPEIGISHARGSWVFEGALAVAFFGDNDQYQVSRTREQSPLYSGQVHLVYNFRPGMWAAVNWTYYAGGRTSVDGVERDDLIQSARWGATFALPIDRQHSIKLYASTGVLARAGTDFTTVGIAWQYRWGEGL
jgi:hypothetical protein